MPIYLSTYFPIHAFKLARQYCKTCKKPRKRQFKVVEQVSEPDSDVKRVLELSDKELK